MVSKRIIFSVVNDGNEVFYSLYFGLLATQIYAQKCLHVSNNKIETSNTKEFSFIIYGGLCNAAEINDLPYPSFELAYELTEEILSRGEDLQTEIFKSWSESKAGSKLIAALPKPDKSKKKVVKSR